MVLKRGLDYGPNSTVFPIIPRGPRSVRRRVSNKDNHIGESKICAFELLAAVAVRLLQESESSASSNAAVEKDPFSGKMLQESRSGFENGKQEIGKFLIPDRGSGAESSCLSGTAVKRSNSKLDQNECDTVPEMGYTISASNISKNDDDKRKMEVPDVKTCIEHKDTSPHCGESSTGYVDNSIERQLEVKGYFKHNADFIGTDTSKDKLEINVNYYPLINTDSRVPLTSFRDCIPNDSSCRRRNSVNVSSRDDGEKFVRFNRCKSKIRASRPQSCIGYKRIRKLSASKYWNVVPKLRDCQSSNSERGMKHVIRNKNYYHTCQRIREEGHFKKRKHIDSSSRHASDREGSSESISNTPEKGIKRKKIGSALKSLKVCGISTSPIINQGLSHHSRDSHVRFSIKSFKVPELYIEVPETATVGSLKRTVMEAVTAILQEELHVGVILQGKRVKDDDRTLLQSGISHNGNLENLGFSLEPTSVLAPPPVSPKVPTLTLLPCETPKQLTRSVADPLLKLGLPNPLDEPLKVAELDNSVKSNQELVPYPTDAVTDGEAPDSKALVPLRAMSVEALSVVPTTQKVKRTEVAHRRIRRPFSVTEVEALVEAVETLGTGRWRDVKLRAFENADHRTYVDLKDKWKTLVHTASISPQQRRGQPVPQMLLDRVMCAHSHWSQHQSKQQNNKNQTELGTV